MKSQILHTVLCNIAGEAAGELLDRSLLGVKGLNAQGIQSLSPVFAFFLFISRFYLLVCLFVCSSVLPCIFLIRVSLTFFDSCFYTYFLSWYFCRPHLLHVAQHKLQHRDREVNLAHDRGGLDRLLFPDLQNWVDHLNRFSFLSFVCTK